MRRYRRRRRQRSTGGGGSGGCARWLRWAEKGRFAEEDVIRKIVTFARQGQPEDICLLSAVGSVSSVTLRHPNSSASPLTYEGMFDIVSLSGWFTPSEVGTSAFYSSGCLKVVLARPGAHLFGGALAGQIIADIPVQVVFGSFLRVGVRRTL